jgi:hypothetical protein
MSNTNNSNSSPKDTKSQKVTINYPSKKSFAGTYCCSVWSGDDLIYNNDIQADSYDDAYDQCKEIAKERLGDIAQVGEGPC